MLLLLATVPLLASAVLGLSARPVGRRLPPHTAVKVLAGTALTTSLASGFGMSVLAFNALARIPLAAAVGQWSASAAGIEGTPPPVGGVLIGLLVVTALLASVLRSLRTATELARATIACRHLPDLAGGLVLLDDPDPDAFALPGLRGKIVITTGMVKALTPPERRVLIAHERAHLSDHHQLYVQAARLASTANPLLIPVASQVRALAERWADERAAAEVQDRLLAARALSRAALARHTAGRAGTATVGVSLSATGRGVAERALALTRPRIPPRPRIAGAVLALAVASGCASVWIAHTTESTFEHAHTAYVAHGVWSR